MEDTIQYRRVIGLEYTLGTGEIKIDMENVTDNYFSKPDEVEINPKNVNLNHFGINDNVITIRFVSPINCNLTTERRFTTMTCGTKLEGDDLETNIEKINDSKKISFYDKELQKKKEEIQKMQENSKTEGDQI